MGLRPRTEEEYQKQFPDEISDEVPNDGGMSDDGKPSDDKPDGGFSKPDTDKIIIKQNTAAKDIISLEDVPSMKTFKWMAHPLD